MNFWNPLKSLKKWRAEVKQQQKLSEMNEVRGNYYLNERGGAIYIVVNGYAIYKAKPDETASEIIVALEKARKVSIEYKENKK